MQITVFGATGGVGKELVKQGLQRGYAVTAVVREARRLPLTGPGLRVATIAALDDPGTLIPVIRGSDAVLSALGPRGRKDGPVVSSSIRAIVSAMDACSTRRFVGVSAAPVGPMAEGESLVNRWVLLPVVKSIFRNVYTDLCGDGSFVAGQRHRLDGRAPAAAGRQTHRRPLSNRLRRQRRPRFLDFSGRRRARHARGPARTADIPPRGRHRVLTKTGPRRDYPFL